MLIFEINTSNLLYIGRINVIMGLLLASLQKKSHKMMKTYKNDVGDKKRRDNHVFH
jgi:hypothetical protein